MYVMTYGMKALGPFLISIATGIISGLLYIFFNIALPQLDIEQYSMYWMCHVAIVGFLVANILYNYFKCVMCPHGGEKYDIVVRELADATGYEYPEDEDGIDGKKRDFERVMMERHRGRRLHNESVRQQNPAAQQQQQLSQSAPSTSSDSSDSSASPTPPVPIQQSGSDGVRAADSRPPPAWVVLGSHEWSFCVRTNQPKPPRSHFDHVSRSLVLNMDHYCPWMANCVGYFNYRYFLNFLIYVWSAMVYALIFAYPLFKASQFSKMYRKRARKGYDIHSEVDKWTMEKASHMPRDQRQMITMGYMICASVGIAVFFLMAFHIYLAASAQTTIEFHANISRRRRARHRGIKWTNPYDLGWYRNLQQVYGKKLGFMALLPSSREPEYLPLPIPGEKGFRKNMLADRKKIDYVESEHRGDLEMGDVDDEQPLLQRNRVLVV